MSLINDALTRASQTAPPPPAVPTAVALRPVEYKQRSSILPFILLPVALIAVLGLAGVVAGPGGVVGLGGVMFKEILELHFTGELLFPDQIPDKAVRIFRDGQTGNVHPARGAVGGGRTPAGADIKYAQPGAQLQRLPHLLALAFRSRFQGFVVGAEDPVRI